MGWDVFFLQWNNCASCGIVAAAMARGWRPLCVCNEWVFQADIAGHRELLRDILLKMSVTLLFHPGGPPHLNLMNI